ncbi:hypothetical protein [Bacillus safensis]|uniref:hypothetical protein n=1 Tax=Bacillus safensis TaxID=561879 RepID=UPI00227F780B|nr:hypothetical protein [Bacillus safensis]MCY7676778.1 hypothetical protein [Bacillus safensis]MCY7700068.1 hypothetical protein [Bacillus safensis]MEC3627101.1 hypothetical protein [Bacillus safensis]
MNLDEILAKPENLITVETEIVYLDGAIDSDENDNYFRLYPASANKSHYLRIKKEDVISDIHMYDLEDLKDTHYKPKLGFTPHNQLNIYQVPVKLKAEVDCITVQKAEIGVKYPLKFAELLSNQNKSSCSCEKKGKSREFREDVSHAYCDVLNPAPCVHPNPCKWCNTMDNTCKCSDCCL